MKYFEDVSIFNLSKYKYVHNFDGHGLLLLYAKNVICLSMTIIELIAATFEQEYRKAII
jgi:hypothetical protein